MDRIDLNGLMAIDVGTSNSCCVVWKDDKPFVVSEQNGFTVPSVVLVKEDSMVYGSAAAKYKGKPNCLYEFKRILGLDFNSPLTQFYMKDWPFTVKTINGDNVPRFIVKIGTQEATFTPGDMYSVFIDYFKRLAEQKTGHPITQVILTVPAHFNDIQRIQVKEAAESCDLTVLRIINEPTAAAITYGVNVSLNHKTILIYDMGGGTFDVTIMRVDNKYEVLSSKGDIHLGGSDFTREMMKLMENCIKQQTGADYVLSSNEKKRLLKCAEEGKIALSCLSEIEVEDEIVEGVGPFIIHRATFEKVVEPYLQRANSVVMDAVQSAKLRPEDINEVVLIGGSSQIPCIKADLKTLFPQCEPLESVNAFTAVAEGALYYAAIQSGRLSSQILFPEVMNEGVRQDYEQYVHKQAVSPSTVLDNIDIVADDYVLEQANDSVYKLITAGKPFGAEKRVSLETMEDYADEIIIRIAQGRDPHFSKNAYYCRLCIYDIPVRPAGEVKVTLSMKVNKNGYVDFSAVTSDGESAEVKLMNPQLMSADAIRANLSKIRSLQESRQQEEGIKYKTLVARVKQLMDASPQSVTPELREWFAAEQVWSQEEHSAEQYMKRQNKVQQQIHSFSNPLPSSSHTPQPIIPPIPEPIPPIPDPIIPPIPEPIPPIPDPIIPPIPDPIPPIPDPILPPPDPIDSISEPVIDSIPEPIINLPIPESSPE